MELPVVVQRLHTRILLKRGARFFGFGHRRKVAQRQEFNRQVRKDVAYLAQLVEIGRGDEETQTLDL
jgi:hypothetical protein